MLTSSEFLIASIITLTAVIFVNPLMLLEGLSKMLQRQKKMPSIKKIEEKLLACHQDTLEKMEKQVQAEVREELAVMAGKHAETLAKLAREITNDYSQSHQELRAAAENHLKDTKLALAEVVKKVEKRVDEGLDQELEKTLAEIKDYKEKRLKKIDDEIAALVEKTIYLTLGKALSPKDHTDIIYESLAEAKEEGFFISNADKR